MTKKSMDSESQAQQNFPKVKWKGNPLNNSDIGYDDEWGDIPMDTTGPFNPNAVLDEDKSKN